MVENEPLLSPESPGLPKLEEGGDINVLTPHRTVVRKAIEQVYIPPWKETLARKLQVDDAFTLPDMLQLLEMLMARISQANHRTLASIQIDLEQQPDLDRQAYLLTMGIRPLLQRIDMFKYALAHRSARAIEALHRHLKGS